MAITLPAPRQFFHLVLLVATGLALADAAPASAQRERRGVSVVEGEWQLVDRNAEARIDHAVVQVTNRMNFFVRGIAADRIDAAVNPDTRVRIQEMGDHVLVAVGRGRPVRLTPGAGYVRTTNAEGQPLRVRAFFRRGVLSVQEVTDQGWRMLTFRRAGDGLVMGVRIHSARLPDDIVYQLRYAPARGSRQIARR